MKKTDAISKANHAMLNSGNEYLVIDNDDHTGYDVIKADDLDDWAPGAYIHYSTDDYIPRNRNRYEETCMDRQTWAGSYSWDY